jgi:hypothetical protein
MINWLREIKAHRSRFYLRAGPERITLFKVTTASEKWQGEKFHEDKAPCIAAVTNETFLE